MIETNDRRLPVGIQSFDVIRKEGYLYVDKTDIIWQLANRNKKYNYLSRPRRFGKSVLVDTLEAYFMGKKELFEGLKIMQQETEWVKRPVIRLDMSRAGAEPETLRSYLNNIFREYEGEYSLVPDPADSLADRFNAIIVGAYKQTGQQVAILIDEYDSPLQHSWKTPHHEACTSIYREVFAILKADDKYEKFVFITGITKFTQISLFSVLNNLSNISFEPEYAAICGITKEEVLRDFKPEINKLAEYENWTFDEAVAKLTAYYDGYHFSRRNMVQSTQAFLNVHLSLGNLPEAMKCLKALIADVPYSNKKLASMDMEERYRLILSTIFNAIGCRVEVEKMIATGRIDMVVETTNFIYVLELKLSNNGGVDAAEEQMKAKQYAEPFKADKRKVIALAIELDDMGKGLVDWKEV